MEKINERFLQVMEYYNQTPSKFADELGVIRSSISHIISGRNKPGLDLIQKLLTTFAEVNADWLILGKGKMIHSKPPEAKPPVAQLSLFDSTSPEFHETDKSKLPESTKINNVPGENIINQPENNKIKNTDLSNTSHAATSSVPAVSIKRITVYFGDKSFQDFYPDVE